MRGAKVHPKLGQLLDRGKKIKKQKNGKRKKQYKTRNKNKSKSLNI